MATKIVFDNLPAKRYSIDLDGNLYRMEIRYNTVDDKWYWSLRTADGEDLLIGHKITIGRPMLYQYRRPTFPEGDFVFALPTALRDPGRDDIEDLVLFYFTEEEYDQLVSDGVIYE